MKGYKNNDTRESDIVFSRTIKAGKRIYYLDVKQNRKSELFLAITESKKIALEDQSLPAQFEKHKIFLYKEDFDKFVVGLSEALDYIRENNTVNFVPQEKASNSFEINNNNIEIIDNEFNLKIDF